MKRSAAFVITALTGNYRIVEVATEGAGFRHYVLEWRLTLGKTDPDSVARFTWWAHDRADFVPLAGSRSLLRAGVLDSLRAVPKDSVVQDVRLSYRAWDYLMLEGAPFDVFDGTGGLYWVYEVSDGGSFAGRWVEGGLGVYVTPTKVGTLGEHPGGYFCAFRLES